MKRIIAFVVGTVAVVATAIGVQVFGTSSADDDKRPPAVSQSTGVSTPSVGSTTTPPDDGSAKEDDGARDGYTEDHTGKPGETK